ncbi:soluble quino protein glucose dehydrogenase [Phanerochaete sordida]|uniref:Soluble quino protein glucose dehydrogenase n=1 Tax=Phanerochaete sordida TaxID=48140 RepID=A0A9P3FZQ5_9APHY|nr:soluble quino protein glucose dehydrogenase [Phanerochaete sordida]
MARRTLLAHTGIALLAAPVFAALARAQCTPHGALAFRSPVTAAPGLAATPIFANLTTPRGIAFDGGGSLLVVERGLGVTAFTEHAPGCAGWFRSVVLADAGLTQGIQVDGPRLYVSTAGEVLRFAYDEATRQVSGEPVTIVDGIPPDGELTTRPILLFPSTDPTHILVSSALATNIDPTARNASSGRSQIRLFPLAPPTSNSSAQDFFSGALLAFGIRNPAGFAFLPPRSPNMWVVDNGASIDNVTGLTAAFVNDNPADELEFVDAAAGAHANRFYGFPDCTTVWNPRADPVGDPQFLNFTTGEQFSLELQPERDNAFCQDPKNNVPPRLSFQAHSVPLDIKFFFPGKGNNAGSSVPASWAGDAFVSFHGSFDRTPPTGYGVVRVPFAGLQPAAPPASQKGYTFLAQATNLTSCPGTCIRPVGLAFASDGRLFVSSDSSGELFIISRKT